MPSQELSGLSSAPKPKAVALLSSGLDSSVALAMARHTHDLALAITFDYGQRAAAREAAQAARFAAHYGIPHRRVALPWFAELASGGALLSKGDLPEPSRSDLDDRAASTKSAKAVWVPNRNGVLIECASAFAEDIGASAVIVGFNREEAATFPDNSEAYMRAISASLKFSTANGLEVISPTVRMDKTEIVKAGLELGVPLDLIWSCYSNGPRMCGVCESCQRLKRALDAHRIPTHDFFDHTNR